MAEPTPAEGHRRTRKDHADEVAEDYCEAIDELIASLGSCRVADLAVRFGVSHVTVSRTLARLVQEGLATTQRHRPVFLTPDGKKLADYSRHRHQLVYRFLVAMGVSEQTAAIDTEGIEHHVSKETLEQMQRFVDGQAGSGSSSDLP